MWGVLLHLLYRSQATDKEWPMSWEASAIQSGLEQERLSVVGVPDEHELEEDYREQRGHFLYYCVESMSQALANANGYVPTCMVTQLASAFTFHQFMDEKHQLLPNERAKTKAAMQLGMMSEKPQYRPWYAGIVSLGELRHQGKQHSVLLIRFFDADEKYGQTFYVPYRFDRKTIYILGSASYVGREKSLMVPKSRIKRKSKS